MYFHGRVHKDTFIHRDRKPFWGKNYCFLKPRMFLVVEFLHQEPEDRLLQPTSRGPAGPERLLCGASAEQVPRYGCMVVGSTEGRFTLPTGFGEGRVCWFPGGTWSSVFLASSYKFRVTQLHLPQKVLTVLCLCHRPDGGGIPPPAGRLRYHRGAGH